MHCVYFLRLSNGDIYKGYSNELWRRIAEHNAGKVESTRSYRPLRLIGYEAYTRKSDAQRRERFLKSSEGLRLFKQQYRDTLRE